MSAKPEPELRQLARALKLTALEPRLLAIFRDQKGELEGRDAAARAAMQAQHPDAKPVVRFRIPLEGGDIAFVDQVRGEVRDPGRIDRGGGPQELLGEIGRAHV